MACFQFFFFVFYPWVYVSVWWVISMIARFTAQFVQKWHIVLPRVSTLLFMHHSLLCLRSIVGTVVNLCQVQCLKSLQGIRYVNNTKFSLKHRYLECRLPVLLLTNLLTASGLGLPPLLRVHAGCFADDVFNLLFKSFTISHLHPRGQGVTDD